MKRAYKHITDSHNVRSIQFHPSGDFLLSATDHTMIRLYDVTTFQAYVSCDTDSQHLAPINQVRYNSQGNIYGSASKDGQIKIWDAVNNKCIHTIRHAHSGAEVSSLSFSSSGKYLLSSGKDSLCRLWEVSTGRQVMSYLGCHQQKYRMQCTFTYGGDFVLAADETALSIIAWDSRTGELVKRLPGHNKVIRCIASSPTEPAFMSCSEDHRARFWSASI